MAFLAHVSLLSGRTVALECGSEEKLEDLKGRAETELGCVGGRLLNSSGRVLNGAVGLQEAGL